MQVSADIHVTNITGEPVRVVGAHIVKPRVEGEAVTKELDSPYSTERWPIPPGESTWVGVHFWVQPVQCGEKEDFIATVVLSDQFGNKLKVKKVRFRSGAARQSVVSLPEEEKLSSIADPVEKQVASVLKSEKERFMSGRDVSGQFGTVLLHLASQRPGGFGTECYNADVPKPVSIYIGSDEPAVESENADALLKLYETLKDAAERETFLRALRSRLAKDTEYEYMGYFVFFVLYRLGRLQDALVDARRYLKGGRLRGYQDLLHLLDELLKYEHPHFSDDNLDWIEAYAEGLDVHTFRIKDRIRDIRIHRVNRTVAGGAD